MPFNFQKPFAYKHALKSLKFLNFYLNLYTEAVFRQTDVSTNYIVMENNIYIKSLEFGVQNMKDGVSYLEMLEYLSICNLQPDNLFENYYANWFFENFFIESLHRYTSEHGYKFAFRKEELDKYKQEKAILTGNAYQNYIDYLELKEARKSSKKAFNTAIAAIILTFISVIFQIITYNYSSKNQKTANLKLEKTESILDSTSETEMSDTSSYDNL